MMDGKTIEELHVGQSAEVSKTITETDIYLFAGITGDFNTVHVNEEYAKTTVFKRRIAHGMLTAGLISHVLGMKLPGPGAVYLKQEVRFLAPVHAGDTITARAEIMEVITGKNRVVMRTTCTNQAGVTVLEGEAVMSPWKKPRES